MDAKAIYDTLDKKTSGSRADWRTTIQLAVIRSSLRRVGSQIRWIPHPLMPVDPMTKADVNKSNDAQFQALRTGDLRLQEVSQEMAERKTDPEAKLCSKAASRRRHLREHTNHLDDEAS